jgi:protein SCO1/2
LTPDGRMSRYLYGVEYDPQTLRLSLVEAADGKIGSTTDRVLLFCYHYDAESGRYGPAAMRLMQLGGLVTVVVLVGGIWVLRRREKGKKAETGPREGDSPLFAADTSGGDAGSTEPRELGQSPPDEVEQSDA